jgi:hypothetical protein
MRMPGFSAESSVTTLAGLGHAALQGTGSSSGSSGLVPQLLNTGGGPQNQDPTWCDLKHSFCMLGCGLMGIYWHFRFSGNVGVLPMACEVACDASRTACQIGL